MKIGDLSDATGVTVPTIRLYEREGLIPGAERTLGGFRIFNDQHLTRLIFIRKLRHLGFQMEEIKRLLISKDFEKAEADISYFESEILSKVKLLEALKSALSIIRVDNVQIRSVDALFIEQISLASRPVIQNRSE